jgi:hypothetical protein
MKKLIPLSLLSALIVIGCGGSSTPTTSPFSGAWSGNYQVLPGASQVGTASITIDSAGNVTGTGRNTTLGINFNISGVIRNNGSLSGTVSGGLTGTLSGTWSISNPGGRLGGAAIQTVAGQQINTTFDLGRA